MKAIVVYESFWGNTAQVAQAIAAGLGAQAYPTGQAGPDLLAGLDLLVVGAPILGFSLTTDSMRRNIGAGTARGPKPDLSNPSMRAWLDSLPSLSAKAAAFETRLVWSPGSAAGVMLDMLARKGCPALTRPGRFIVKGTYGPLRGGELERAQQWGRELAMLAG